MLATIVIAIIIIYNLLKFVLDKGDSIESEVTEAGSRAGAENGSREDYVRGYYVSAERESDGFGQDFDGYRSGARF